jgi:serine/threonine protein phosphatase PrpC
LADLGDGIYDKLSNSEVIDIVWDTLSRERGRFKTIHEFCGKAVENIMKLAFHKKTLDNITVVMIALEGLQNYFTKL